jgi:CubicO group peptidase (beta-lactamase class C family)
MTLGTVFDLASVTKVAATTMAVMLLVDRGALDLDTPLSRYLPELDRGGKDRITARQLLTHTSGLPSWQPLYYQAERPEEVLAAIASMPLDWGVGEERHYSDLGFMILGFLVEAVSGMSMDDFLSTELYGPLGLGDTGFKPDRVEGVFAATSHGNPYERRMVHDSMFGYRYAGDPVSWNGWRHYTLLGEVNDGNAFHALGGVAGHAGLFSTAGDLKLLLQVLLQEGSLFGRRYLGPETVKAFLEPDRPGQALGWRIPNWGPEGSFAHTGFTGTFVMGVPALDLAVVLLTNRQNLGVDVNTGRYPDLGPLQENVATAAVRAARNVAEG